MNPRWWLPLVAFACASAIPLPAVAQDAAAAAALYERGLADMLAGKLSSACPALAESYRLDPLPGALFTLAECEGKVGRFATAVARYEEYLATYARLSAKEKAGQKGRNKLAETARRKLLPSVPTVTIQLPASAPEGTRVLRDGVLLNAPALGVPLPIDPGDHVLTTQVPDGPEHEQRFSIAAGAKQEILLELVMSKPGDAGAKPSKASAEVSAEPPRQAHSRWLTYVGFGLGGAGVIAGAVTGAISWSKTSDIKDACAANQCPESRSADIDSAQTWATVSNVSFIVGAAGIGVGIVSLLTRSSKTADAPQPAAVSVVPSFGPGYAGIQGRF